jgi:hypothetical protein
LPQFLEINELPKHLRSESNAEEEELKRLAKERAEKLKKLNSDEL